MEIKIGSYIYSQIKTHILAKIKMNLVSCVMCAPDVYRRIGKHR